MAKKFSLVRCGDGCLKAIKKASWFPYKTGFLMNNVTNGMKINETTYRIQFSESIARQHPNNKGKQRNYTYVDVLENGCPPFNIPNAFGRGKDFGTSGRFEGKFHPAITKHKGFISNKSVNACIKYICDNYNGELR